MEMDETNTATSADTSTDTQSNIRTYEAPWLIYGMSFSFNYQHGYRLAIGSFIEAVDNKIEILQIANEDEPVLPRYDFDHPYPPTKLMWIPDKAGTHPDLLITASDFLRVWRIKETSADLKSKLVKKRQDQQFGAPLTSFDWNVMDVNKVGASSIDTTCTVWDIEREAAVTQLIAHEKEVYDFAFGHGTNMFATVSADGSLRQFDMRALEHSTILYESQGFNPLVRLAWNKLDGNYLATLAMDSNSLTILDIRTPSVPLFELRNHENSINSLAWSPTSSCHICTAGDDYQALIWDLKSSSQIISDPFLNYKAETAISTLQWSDLEPVWLGISFNKKLQLLKI